MTHSTTDPNSPQGETTHFGYQKIPVDEKQERVAEVFRSVATRYDIMNDLMSLGTHRLIKRFTIELSGLRQGNRVLDLAGGTGDLSIRFSPIVGKEGHVVLADINAAMLKVGRDRIVDRGLQSNITVAQSDAECLPFANNCFDCVCIAYGLRNVTRKGRALESILRVLKPGGRLLVLSPRIRRESGRRMRLKRRRGKLSRHCRVLKRLAAVRHSARRAAFWKRPAPRVRPVQS